MAKKKKSKKSKGKGGDSKVLRLPDIVRANRRKAKEQHPNTTETTETDESQAEERPNFHRMKLVELFQEIQEKRDRQMLNRNPSINVNIEKVEIHISVKE